jgi:hypothetical protein
MEIVADGDGIVGVAQLITMAGDEFDRIERESMYIFSLIVWSALSKTADYAEASEVLLGLYNKSFESLPAQVENEDWAFGIGELTICPPLRTLALIAQSDRSGADAIASIEALAKRKCSLLP